MSGEVQHKNVYSALCAAQMAMEPVLKGALNPAFKGEGKPKGTAYADLADVVSAVRPALSTNGLAYFHQMVMFDEKPAMRTVLYHGDSETSLFCDVPLIVQKNDMQGMKSATTYAKRIGLESVTGVAPEDDDGNASAKSPPMVEDRPKPVAAGAIDQACTYLAGADDIADLKRIWTNIPEDVKREARVISAKNARKAELEAFADLGGDSLPY